MSRRPQLKVGNLYYVKMKEVWMFRHDFDHPAYGSFDYIARIKEIGTPPSLFNGILLTILASTQDRPSEELHYHAEEGYVWERPIDNGVGNGTVIQNYNPKNLPLYLNWVYGKDWIQQQLKELTL